VSVPLRFSCSRAGPFVTHIATLPGNPYDGHTLAEIIPTMEAPIGNKLERLSRPQRIARLKV
jgi:IS5 family transposase